MDPVFSTLFFLWGVVTGWGATEVFHGVFDEPACPVAYEDCMLEPEADCIEESLKD